jgi:hypothetical protein
MRLLNIWRSDAIHRYWYEFGKEIYRNGDFAIYKETDKSFLYSFKNIAISNLAGKNKELVDRLADNKPFEGPYNSQHFLYERALEGIERGLKLLQYEMV